MFKRFVGGVYREVIADQKSGTAFWILAGFVPTIILARLTVHLVPGLFLSIHNHHVHHFAYGIIILAIAGYLALITPERLKRAVASFYGIGLALAFDEFGMWLHLTDNYNLDLSEDALVIILLFLVAAVYLAKITRRAAKYIKHR